MVDLHTHILPSIDDGARNMDDALEMARMAVNDGVTTIVATPHAYWEGAVNGGPVINRGVSELTDALGREGIALRILPGAEVPIERKLVDKIQRDPTWTIGAQNTYLLLEPPWGPLPEYSVQLVSDLMDLGITSIIAHPERSPDIQANPSALDRFLEIGALAQVTANSLLGRHGNTAKTVALKFLHSGRAHVISSDAHNCKNRAPLLGEARELVETLVGPEMALALFEQNPQRIVDGMSIDALPTARAGRSSGGGKSGGFFSRLLGRGS